MSTKDISRFLFQPRKHYTGMRMQQGRILLDSDYNEGAWHDDEDQRRTLEDLIGPQGSPDQGFAIGTSVGPDIVKLQPGHTLDTVSMSLNGSPGVTVVPAYYIMPGSMYVGGLRVELEEPEFIAFQSDFLQYQIGDVPFDFPTSPPSTPPSPPVAFGHFFFMHVWEQCVTAVEDEEILERALGGPDTSVRVRRMRRVEFGGAFDDEDCASALARILEEEFPTATFDPSTGALRSEGRLRIQFTDGESEDTCAPCNPESTGRYLGAENQAIRIMLTTESSYVWAFDNAAPLYRASLLGVDETPSEVVVTMLTLPKDEEHWPLEGRVVEILPWSAVLDNGEKVADEVGVICRVSESYDPETKSFKLDTGVGMAALNALVHAWDSGHPHIDDLNDAVGGERLFYLRFWHQTDASTPPQISTSAGGALGTTGLVPHFLAPGRRGDFWVAAVRPETPDQIVPYDLQQNPEGVPPHGPHHFYAPLALIRGASQTVSSVEDCRRPIQPISDMGCCTFVVGDGLHSFGQFTKIQDAVNALPPEGGKVCVRPGVYVEDVSIQGRTNVVIEGCGDRSVVTPPAGSTADYVFTIGGGSNNTLRSLQIQAPRGSVSIGGSPDARLEDLSIVEQPSSGVGPSWHVTLGGGHGTQIRGLRAELLLRGVIILSGASDILMEDLDLRDVGTPFSTVPMIHTGGATRATLRNSTLVARGRHALDGSGNPRMIVERVLFDCANAGANPARGAINSDGGMADWDIAGCTFVCTGTSDDAAIAVSGDRAVVRDCVISSAPQFWGGIHVRGGTGVRIMDNRIVGGAGHGITLGNVGWRQVGGTTTRFSEGAGRGQKTAGNLVTGDLRGGFTEVISGTTVQFFVEQASGPSSVTITGNLIEEMRCNGISALTVLGLPEGVDLIACKSLVIENNQIRRNLLGPFAAVDSIIDAAPIAGSANGVQAGSGLQLPVIPFAGIVVSVGLDRLIIRNNVIHDNAFTGTVPTTLHAISGIFVLLGEGIVISGNNIAQNGDIPDDTTTTLIRSGLRAGIGVVHASTGVPEDVDDFDASFASLGTAPHDCALQVSNNVVRQPEGRALFAVASGAVSVTANFLSSRGFHGANSPSSPPDTTAIGDVVFVQCLGKPWEALTTGSPALTNVRQPQWTSSYLQDNLAAEFSSPPNNLFFVGLGGHLLFNDNHVVYDWVVERYPTTFLSYFAVALLSLDHVGMHGNQVAFRMDRTAPLQSPPVIIPPPSTGSTPAPYGPELLLSNVFAMGATVQVTSNRVSEALENLESSYLSILTYGLLMNTTALNQTSRCVAAYSRQFGDWLASPPLPVSRWRIETQNLVMASQLVPRESNPASPDNPLTPCHAFYTSGSLWSLMAEFTRLFVDKRVP